MFVFYRAEYNDVIGLLLVLKHLVIWGTSPLLAGFAHELDLFNCPQEADPCYNDRYCYMNKSIMSLGFFLSMKKQIYVQRFYFSLFFKCKYVTYIKMVFDIDYYI